MRNLICILSPGVLLMLGAQLAVAQGDSMSFFVTSEGSGNGGDLGGLEGADVHCEALSDAVGAGDREWRAYLGTRGRLADGVYRPERESAMDLGTTRQVRWWPPMSMTFISVPISPERQRSMRTGTGSTASALSRIGTIS